MLGSTVSVYPFPALITSHFYFSPSLRTGRERLQILHYLKTKTQKYFCKMSQNLARLLLYSKITFAIISLGTRISIHFILKTEERHNVNKYACWLLTNSEPHGNNDDQLWVYTCLTDQESGLGLQG